MKKHAGIYSDVKISKRTADIIVSVLFAVLFAALIYIIFIE